MVTDTIELMSPGIQPPPPPLPPTPADGPTRAAIAVGREAEPVDARTARWAAINRLNALLNVPQHNGRLGEADRWFLRDAAELELMARHDVGELPNAALQLIRDEVDRIAARVSAVDPAGRPSRPRLAPDNAVHWE